MVSKKKIKLICIIFGIILIGLGIFFNAISSDIGRDEVGFNLEPGNYDINKFSPNLIPNIKEAKEVNIQLYGSFYSTSNTSILFLNNSEYQKYLDGENISNITAFLEIDGTYYPSDNLLKFEKILSIQKSSLTAILVRNNESSTINGYYSIIYSIVSPFYYYGLILMIIGCLISLSVASYYFIEWKRYLMVGIEISSLVFLTRVAIFPILPGNLNFLSIFNLFDIEIYRDFEYYYCLWGEIFRDGNWIFSGAYPAYNYGPLFMLILGAFSLIPMPLWCMAIPLLISTIGTGYLVFKVSKKITNNDKYGIYAMLLYFINPFTLLYSSFGWLNPSLFVFFIILSFYLILENKFTWAIISLAISTMFKQFAIIFIPIFLILIIRMRKDSKLALKIKNFLLYSLCYIGIIFLISLPFLIVNYNIFIQKFILGGSTISFDYLTTLYLFPGAMVHFNTLFLIIGTPEIITNIIALLLQYYILLGLFLLGINLYFLLYSPKSSENLQGKEFFIISLFLSILTILSFHIFYPRGSFKYYLILLAPFISILFGATLKAEKKQDFHFKAIYLLPTIISWIIFFINRYIYFWIILVWIIYYFLILYNTSKETYCLPVMNYV